MHTRRTHRRALLASVLILVAAQLAVIVDHARADTTTDTTTTQPTSTAYAAATINYGSGLWAGPGSIVRVGNPATATDLMVGDSITARCASKLVAAFTARGRTLAVIAQSGQNTQGLAALLMAEPRLPGRVVFFGGANDVFNPFGFAPWFGKVVTYTQDAGATLYAVDTYVGRPATAVDDARNSGQVNQAIYQAAPHVISTVAALTAARGRGRPLSYYLQDGVHYWTAAGTGHGDGCAFLAATVADGVS
jgi:hypothetical protein